MKIGGGVARGAGGVHEGSIWVTRGVIRSIAGGARRSPSRSLGYLTSHTLPAFIITIIISYMSFLTLLTTLSLFAYPYPFRICLNKDVCIELLISGIEICHLAVFSYVTFKQKT